jgi:prepilin-type N-terminal cleavage/methylation domain-containing protein
MSRAAHHPILRVGRVGRVGAHRGFTLVELMIVVAIVGVLAVLGIVGYRKLTLSAKVSEAKTMVSAIRIAQEDYKVERGVYANIGTNFCPASGAAQVKTAWNPECAGSGTTKWLILPVHVDGPVQFGYATIAAPAVIPADVKAWVDTTAADTSKPYYVIMAQADLDGDGATMTKVVGTSFDNNIHTQNEGQ